MTVTNSELFTRCSTPLLGNVTYGLIKDYNLQEPCNISDATAQSIAITDFMFKSASFSFEECQSTIFLDFSVFLKTTRFIQEKLGIIHITIISLTLFNF